MSTPKGIFHMDPNDVKLRKEPTQRDVAHQRNRLLDEGQIQPLLIDHNSRVIDPGEWFYADAQVVAARELKWPTILVTYDEEVSG